MTLLRTHISLFETAVIEGNAYFISSFTILNNNEIIEFSITAPQEPPETIGLALIIDPTNQLHVEVFRDATLNIVPGGTILTLNNQNGKFQDVNIADTVVRRNPTIDADGLQLENKLLADGHKNAAEVGDTTLSIILEAEDETTLVRLTSGGANNTINFRIQVVEETQ